MVTVHGKGSELDRLPLPVEVGEAITAYLRRGRPATPSREIFIRSVPPRVALTRAGVSGLVLAASQRAGLGRDVRAHQLLTYAQFASQAMLQDGTQAGTRTGTQAGTQSGTQDGTQDGTQSLSETLSCDLSDGHHTFTRDGSRDGTRSGTRSGTRDGSRDGTRSGTRTGSVDGNVSYTIDYDPRVKNQIDGFFLTGAHTTGFVASGDPVWGDYTWGDTTWGDWNSAPDDNPNVCNSGSPGVSNYSDVVTAGTPTDGAVTDGAVTYGTVTPTGAAHLYLKRCRALLTATPFAATRLHSSGASLEGEEAPELVSAPTARPLRAFAACR